MSKAYISDLENGSAGKPNIQYIFAIATALDTTLDELLHDVVISAPPSKSKRNKTEPPPGGCLNSRQSSNYPMRMLTVLLQ